MRNHKPVRPYQSNVLPVTRGTKTKRLDMHQTESKLKFLVNARDKNVAFTNHFGTIPPRLSSCLLLTTSLPITRSENHHVHIAIDGFGRTNHTCLFVSKARGPLQLSLHRSSFFFFLTLLRFSLTLLTEPTNSRAQLPSPPPSVRAIAPSPAT